MTNDKFLEIINNIRNYSHELKEVCVNKDFYLITNPLQNGIDFEIEKIHIQTYLQGRVKHIKYNFNSGIELKINEYNKDDYDEFISNLAITQNGAKIEIIRKLENFRKNKIDKIINKLKSEIASESCEYID